MHKHVVQWGAALLCAGATMWTASARAQERPYLEREVPAPADALELKVGTEYTQGFGMIAPGLSVRDAAGAGIGVHADLDYRATPRWSLGLQGEYQELTAERDTGARGVAANVGVTYHTSPYVHGDPWLRLGAGYRMLWEVNPPGAPTTLLHGFELAKATLGYDLRFSRGVAIAPQIGADLDLFTWQDQNGTNTALSTAQVATFIFAGLQGRFDVGGASVAPGGTFAKNLR